MLIQFDLLFCVLLKLVFIYNMNFSSDETCRGLTIITLVQGKT